MNIESSKYRISSGESQRVDRDGVSMRKKKRGNTYHHGSKAFNDENPPPAMITTNAVHFGNGGC